MALAHIQCFCGTRIGLSAPKNSFSRAAPLPQEYTAKCPCGRNWRLILSRHNPGYKPGQVLCDAGAHAGNGETEIAP